jgi:hypothetical protein
MTECPYCVGSGLLSAGVVELRRCCEIRGIEVGLDGTVTRKDAARLLRRSSFTLRNWAYEGKGPKFIKCSNGRYRYRLEDLDEWRYAGED